MSASAGTAPGAGGSTHQSNIKALNTDGAWKVTERIDVPHEPVRPPLALDLVFALDLVLLLILAFDLDLAFDRGHEREEGAGRPGDWPATFRRSVAGNPPATQALLLLGVDFDLGLKNLI